MDLDPTPNTVTVDVTPVNDDPVAADDSTTVDEDASVTLDVRTNDNAGPNESGQTLTVSIFSAPAHGTAVMDGGSITYTPACRLPRAGPVLLHPLRRRRRSDPLRRHAAR